MAKPMSKGLKNTIIITAILLVVIIVALLLINPIKNAISKVIPVTDVIEDGYVMYNASRYFCRLNYPKEWVVSNHDFGFMLDSEIGKVLRINPAKRIYVEKDEDSNDDVDLAFTSEIDNSLYIDLYYFSVNQGEDLTIYQAYNRFVTSFAKEKFIDSALIGSYSPKITDNNEFLVSTFSYYETIEVQDEEEGTKTIHVLRDGNIYVAVRGMAYYGIVVSGSGTDASGGAPLQTYKNEIDTIINSFRFSVFNY